MPLLGGVINGDQYLRTIYIRVISKLCFVVNALLSTVLDTNFGYKMCCTYLIVCVDERVNSLSAPVILIITVVF